jgi:hypothetical protein
MRLLCQRGFCGGTAKIFLVLWMAFVLFLVCAACVPVLTAQELRITDFTIAPGGRPTLHFGSDSNSYYILYRGNTITNIAHPVDVRMGQADQGQLVDPSFAATNASAFYRIRQVPLNQPLDSDSDGIDDVYELRRPQFPQPSQSGRCIAGFR